jgi:hypothetical protein
MSGISKKLMGTTAAGGGELLAIEDVFSTYLYTGTGSALTITNGIDLAGEGGLVWIKDRSFTRNHHLVDTERGIGGVRSLATNSTAAEVYLPAYSSYEVTSVNSDGFSLGLNLSNETNRSGDNYASWTFRKAPRFFDCVEYTGDGASSRAISHNLGVVPGCVIVKRTNEVGNWETYHRGVNSGVNPEDYKMALNSTADQVGVTGAWANTAPTDSVFYVNGTANTNDSPFTYVAYLFAHDPLGPSEDGSDGLIACGSYTGNGSTTGPVIDLGWEPQWVLVKGASSNAAFNWSVFDNMRGVTTGGNDQRLYANSSGAEATTVGDDIYFTSRGFGIGVNYGYLNASGENYIYIAIRRGPMRAPTSGTEVFAVDLSGSTAPRFESSFPVDMAFWRPTVSSNTKIASRLTGKKSLLTNDTSLEDSANANVWDFMDGFYDGGITSNYAWMFRRAPGFFDVVAYGSDNTSSQTISHNLGVTPEMFIVKVRDTTGAWGIYHKDVGNTAMLRFNIGTPLVGVDYFNNTSPTDADFTVGTYFNGTLGHPTKYIAYLFATLPGVSKVGSYTGNGTSQTIDCGFTSGARFVLIKCATAVDSWFVFDTARGIVSGNDPYLNLDNTDQEITSQDFVDPDPSGFSVVGDNVGINRLGDTYIFLAIA